MDECHLPLKFQTVPRQKMLSVFIAGGSGRKEGRHACHFSAVHPQESKENPIDKVGCHSSCLTFIKSGLPTPFMKINWSKRKRWVEHSSKHSVMLLFTSETFHQNAWQELSDKSRLSCMKDQKSHTTIRQSRADFRSSGARLLDQAQQQKRLDVNKSLC